MTEPAPPKNPLPGYHTEFAYHGTTVDRARAIDLEKCFRLPTKVETEHRFGLGVYFWENSKEAARTWVRISFGPGTPAGIVRATVSGKKLLDLLTREHTAYLDQVKGYLARKSGTTFNKITDAAVLSVMHKLGFIDCARLIAGASGSQIHPISGRSGPFDVILCVYEPNNVIVREVEL